MHWCVNINALQRPFSSDFLFSWLLPSPEESVFFPLWNIISCFWGQRFLAIPAAWQQTATREEKKDVEREWIELWLHISTPSRTQGILLLLYGVLHPVTIRSRCAIKPLYVFYIHVTVGSNFKSHVDPGLSFSQKLTDQGPEVGGGLHHLILTGGRSVVLQKQIISSGEEKGSEGSDWTAAEIISIVSRWQISQHTSTFPSLSPG